MYMNPKNVYTVDRMWVCGCVNDRQADRGRKKNEGKENQKIRYMYERDRGREIRAKDNTRGKNIKISLNQSITHDKRN